MRLLFRWLFTQTESLPLGRWCHPLSSARCNQDVKAHLANIDNSFTSLATKKIKRQNEETTRDTVSVFVDTYGF